MSFDTAFASGDGSHRDQRRYRGASKPRRHFLGPDQMPAFDGAADGEELQCGQSLDSHAGVRFWIRNVPRHLNSLWLPTATDRFFSNFFAELDDGRLLVVEHKAAHLAEGSTRPRNAP